MIKKGLAFAVITVILLSTFASVTINPSVLAQPNAILTGRVFDDGLDTDMDVLFNYLVVDIEVDVVSAGDYRVQIGHLRDEYYSSVYFYSANETFLDVGVQNVTILLDGIAIYGSRINATHVVDISLSYWEGYTQYYQSITEMPLSQTYNYTLFDTGATLTGAIYDEGIDTDTDGLFNLLEVNVEIDVADAADYEVYVSGLEDGIYVSVYNYVQAYLSPGIQNVSVTLNTARIYASRGNVSRVSYIGLDFILDYRSYWLDDDSYLPLNRTYRYDEFDPLAFFTGTILDVGIDDDIDGLFDYLQISVEVNVTDPGYYEIDIWKLSNSGSTYIDFPSYVGKSFETGVHLVNFTVYGPRIYAERIDPTYLETVTLTGYPDGERTVLEELYVVPLPLSYRYYQFESHAFLTGNVDDRGVDTDSDQLFDYLEVSVEVNVTEAGTYRVSVGGLTDETGSRHISYDGEQFIDFLDLGFHWINFTFSGPKIAYYHINPANITGLYLTEISTSQDLSHIPTAALPTPYDYTQFNSPFSDMQIEFTVYPNATLGINGSINNTRAYPPYYNSPLVNATLGFSTEGDVTTGSVNGTMILPENSVGESPLNSTTVDLVSEYYNGMLNAQLNATMLMPPEGSTTYPFNSSDFSLLATYSDGMLDAHLLGYTELPSFYASQLPFNITDVTVLADYKDNEINGNITFHTVSGFPLADVIVYFNGNKTEISFTGYIDVIYGEYFGMTINSTVLEDMLAQFNSTIPGRGENSLYNMTEGIIECTVLNTTKTPIVTPPGARIDYNATIAGNFTDLLATYLTYMFFGSWPTEEQHSVVYAALESALSSVDSGSLTLTYFYGSGIADIDLTLSCDVKALWSNALQLVPPTIPAEYRSQFEAWLKIANITAHSVENANVEAAYSSIAQTLDFQASLMANITKLESEIIPLLPDAVPPELRDFVGSCTNTTFCNLESMNTTCKYVNGVTDFDAAWVLRGDFRAELNRIKHCYIEYLNLTSPYMINWQILMLNATDIDISNLEMEIRQGEDWMTLTFEGPKLYPEKDHVDFIRFKLYRLFNMSTDPYESPREFEKLKIIVSSGSNATHTVLLYAPGTVPSPDVTSLDYKVMTWENVTMSSLKDLLFRIAFQGVIDYLGETYYVPVFTNSTVSDFNFDPDAKSIRFNVTGTAGIGFCNITIPRALMYAEPAWIVRVDGVPLSAGNFSVAENLEYAFIYIDYSHSTHLIEIEGTWIVTEFSPNILALVLVIASLVAAILAVKQRRNLNNLKTRYQKRLLRSLANFAKKN